MSRKKNKVFIKKESKIMNKYVIKILKRREKMKRFILKKGKMEEHKSGDWVKYEDVKKTPKKKKTGKKKEKTSKLIQMPYIKLLMKKFPGQGSTKDKIKVEKNDFYYWGGGIYVKIKNCNKKDGIYFLYNNSTLLEDKENDLDNYPIVPHPDYLKKALETAYISYEDLDYFEKILSNFISNPNLKGICLRGNEIAVTDNRAIIIIDSENKIKKETEIIIPRDIIPLLKKQKENIKIEILKEYNLRITQGDLTIYCNRIDGNYPNYQQVIPKSTKHYFEFDKEEMKKTIKELKKFKSEKIRFDTKKKEILVYVNGELKATKINFDTDYNENIMFQFKYFEYILNIYDLPKKVKMGFNNFDQLFIIRYKDKTILQMPCKNVD